MNLDAIKYQIARPDIGALLAPLQEYRGGHDMRRMHRLWNFTNAMMEAGCDTLGDGVKLSNTDMWHLCGAHSKAAAHLSLRMFFARLNMCPKVTRTVPCLTEYVDHVLPWPIRLNRLAGYTVSAKNRTVLKRLQEEIGKSSELAYPYFCGDLSAESRMMIAIHDMVPSFVPHQIRGDLCQDIVVEVVAGNLTLENVPDQMHRFMREAKRFEPHCAEDFERLSRHIKVTDCSHSWQQQAGYAKASFNPCEGCGKSRSYGSGRLCRDCYRSKTKPRGGRMSLPNDYFELFKAAYPKRHGDQGWAKVRRLIPARIADGYEWAQIMAGVNNYAIYCARQQSIGTPYVKQACTFVGTDCWFLEWATMDLRSPAQIAEDTRRADLQRRAEALGFKTVDFTRGYDIALRAVESEERKRAQSVMDEVGLKPRLVAVK